MSFLRSNAVAEAQGWRCCFCGFRMISSRPSKHEKRAVLEVAHPRFRGLAAAMRVATRDHLVPRCDGGTYARENLVAACRWCNHYRGNRPADEAFARIQRLLSRGTHPHQVWTATGAFPRVQPLRAIQRNRAETTAPAALELEASE